ncbi:hypothetical protein [Actinomadura kijaniata]|uniref:hypothetical protein n=1 Tax=Actinomadura kijaniata TaxID=46161 RepID=UPI00082CFA90|nr:hypothetical protein [Actinomadura kijaniata]
MTPRDVLLVVLRDLFPQWEIWVCDRGVWRAAGSMLVSSSTVEGLVEHLAGADPGSFAKAARRLVERSA